MVRAADVLQINLPDRHLSITIVDIPGRRGPAAEAGACYRVDTTVQIATRRRGERAFGAMPAPPKRPDKQDRRKLRAPKGRDIET